MKKYIVTYHAPDELLQQSRDSTPEEMEKGMEAWYGWAKKCGDKLVDLGNPLVNGQTLKPDGNSKNSTHGVCGYSILQAENMEEAKNKIMHISLPINKETILMGSDSIGDWAPKTVTGNNISLSITTNRKEKADEVFKKLSKDGSVTMPVENTFWGDYFGMCTDQFGINWMISFNSSEED